MPIRRIVKFGDPVLETPTNRVEKITDEIRSLVDDMCEPTYAAPGALATSRRKLHGSPSSQSTGRR